MNCSCRSISRSHNYCETSQSRQLPQGNPQGLMAISSNANKETEDIKKRWQEYTDLYKKDLHDPDRQDSVITHLEPDILE